MTHSSRTMRHRAVVPMLVAAIATALVFALGSAAARADSNTRIDGWSDQNIATWPQLGHDLQQAIGLPRARFIVNWDAALHAPGPGGCAQTDSACHGYVNVSRWIDAAQDKGMQVLISFSYSGSTLPEPIDYRYGVDQFRAHFPDVTEFTAWNEPNHNPSGPTFTNPTANRAARYWNQLNAACQTVSGTGKRCTAIAGDFSDFDITADVDTYTEAYKDALSAEPTDWAVHAYDAVATGDIGDSSKLSRWVNRYTDGRPVWITEVGAYYCTMGGGILGEGSQNRSAQRLNALMQAAPSTVDHVFYYLLAPENNKRVRCPEVNGVVEDDPALLQSNTAFRPALRTLFPQLQAPSVSTETAAGIGMAGAVLNGAVNPQGMPTTYRFEYGPTTAYGSIAPVPDGNAGAGRTGTNRSVSIAGLRPNTTYHYRIVASNVFGTAYGANRTFTTKPSSTPSAVVEADGDRRVFFRGENDQLQEWRWDGSAWSHHGIGVAGLLASNPSAVVTTNGIVEVYYRNHAGEMWRWRLGDGLAQHAGYGDPNDVVGDPSAVPTATGGAEVFFRTSTNQLGRWAFNGADYHRTSYSEPGMAVVGDPAAVALADGSFEAVYRTPTNQMGRWRFAGAAIPWPSINGYAGTVGGDPAAVATGGTSYQVFYRNPTGQLGRWYFNGAGRNNTEWGVNGLVGGDPTVVRTRTGRLEVLYRTPQDSIGRYWFLGDAYQDSTAGVAGAVAGDPAAIVTPGGAVSVYYGGSDAGWWDYSYLPDGGGQNFARLQPAPAVTVGDVSDLGVQQARLHGSVDPRGLRTRWTFQYGTTTRYGSNAPIVDGDAGSGNGPVDVNALATGLLAGTTYHYRLVGTSMMGTVYSEDRTFKTAPMPKPSVIVAPDGDKHVFYRTLAGQLAEWRWDGTSWRNIGWGTQGIVAGNPSAVMTDSGVIEVYHRKAGDNQLRRWRIFEGGHNEAVYDDAGALPGDPVAIATGGERVEVFAATSIGQLGRWTIDGASDDYTSYGYQGDLAAATPAVVESQEGVLDVVFRSGTGQLGRWTIFAAGHNPNLYGTNGSVTGNPSIVATADGILDVVHRTGTGTLGRWTLFGSSNNPNGYGTNGSVVGSPSAVATGGGAFESFHRTDDGKLGRWWIGGGERQWNPSTWGDAGSVAGDPTVIRLSDGTLNVFYGRPDAGYAFHEFGRSGDRYVPIG